MTFLYLFARTLERASSSRSTGSSPDNIMIFLWRSIKMAAYFLFFFFCIVNDLLATDFFLT